MGEVVKAGWWARQSKGAKAGIVIGTIVVVAGISYLIYRSTRDEKPEGDGGGRDGSTEETRPDGEHDTHNEVGSNDTTTGGQASNTGTSASNVALPNNGSGCGVIRTAFDRNYDYVRCASVWYTRSKDNPATPSLKNSIPNWKSLSENKVASDRLNVAYPQG